VISQLLQEEEEEFEEEELEEHKNEQEKEIFELPPDNEWEAEYLVPNLSPHQIFAVRFFRDHHSIAELQHYKDFKYPSTIRRCIERAAFGLRWEPKLEVGNRPYLCPHDEAQINQMFKKNVLQC
jgi:hypothetical protein